MNNVSSQIISFKNICIVMGLGAAIYGLGKLTGKSIFPMKKINDGIKKITSEFQQINSVVNDLPKHNISPSRVSNVSKTPNSNPYAIKPPQQNLSDAEKKAQEAFLKVYNPYVKAMEELELLKGQDASQKKINKKVLQVSEKLDAIVKFLKKDKNKNASAITFFEGMSKSTRLMASNKLDEGMGVIESTMFKLMGEQKN